MDQTKDGQITVDSVLKTRVPNYSACLHVHSSQHNAAVNHLE